MRIHKLSLVVCWRNSSRETILVDMLLGERGATGTHTELIRGLIMTRPFASLVPTNSNTSVESDDFFIAHEHATSGQNINYVGMVCATLV
jgi:hypothetical protein